MVIEKPAQLYFPFTENAETEVAYLRNLIRRNNEFDDELEKTNYNPYNKALTPKQVRAVADFLGEP